MEGAKLPATFGYVSATKLIVNTLLLVSAVFSALSISYIVYLRANIPPLVLARAFHLLLIPALLMIGLDITTHRRYMLGATLISITAAVIDLMLHILNFAFDFVFLNRAASLSALFSSLTPTVILIIAITLIGTENVVEIYNRAMNWITLLSQLSIIVATAGMILAILNVFSPSWTLIWFLALPNWVIAEGFRLSQRPTIGAAFSAGSSGFNIVATIVALFTLQTPPMDFITLLFVTILNLPVGNSIAFILTFIKLILLLSIFVLYGVQFAISATIALDLSRKRIKTILPILASLKPKKAKEL